MSKSAKWLPLGLMAGAFLALIAAFGFSATTHAQANQATVAVGTVNCTPGQTSTQTGTGPVTGCAVDITVTPETGVTVGALDFTIAYNNANLSSPLCAISQGTGACNPTFTASSISFSVANVSGFSGDIGDVGFTAGTTEATEPLTLALTTCADEQGNSLTCAMTDGSIVISQATATPTESPTPTGGATESPTPTGGAATPTPTGAAGGSATPTGTGARSATPTAAGLPRTGGSDSDGMGALPFALGALGLAVVAGGVWAVARMRRTGA